jgi:hypothetical protein
MKFVGLQIDNNLNLVNYIDKLIYSLSGTCYTVRSVCHTSNTDTLKLIYLAYSPFTVK